MKVLSLILCLLLSLQVSAHCGSCGSGGDESDHAAGEDTDHHEKDKQFKKNAGKRADMDDDDSDDEGDDNSDDE